MASCLCLLASLPGFGGPHQVLVPEISVSETEFNFGKLEEGIETRHTFKITNKGKKPLKIFETKATCGCTVPKVKKDLIAPGETVDLEVVMDTSMKQGNVSKPITIRSNDPMKRVLTIHVKAQVRGPHADLVSSGEQRTAKIFTGRCAACHVEKGVGKIGEELFMADCSMCHGARAKGIPGVAPALTPFDYHQKDFAAHMRKIIAFGSKAHRSMPGYLKTAGGPLSDSEIDSLVEYLKWKSDLDLKPKTH
jgi:mono/diheme cytochrome c family protein